MAGGPGRGRGPQGAMVWPGFLDLMTSLVMVLMFVLTVFMIVQFALRDTINTQGSQLADLNARLAGLADQLGLEEAKADDLQVQLADLQGRYATLSGENTGLQGQVAALGVDLEKARKQAEETLTLLAAAQAAKAQLETEKAAQISETDRQKALLAAANAALAKEQGVSAEGARQVALLNAQVAALREQLASLQEALDASKARDAQADVQIENLGSQLNQALAQVAVEQKRRAALEEAERQHLEAEAKALKSQAEELARYRSEFFGKLSEVLKGREGVRIVGDRFVFSSEVLFKPGAADLSDEGRAQIASVTATLKEIAAEIPPQLAWIIRVDGHTDNQPLSGEGEFKDNWDLSAARALSVVRYMQDDLGFPPDHLAATGFGEFQPVAEGDTPEARAQNRRIELKLTDR